MNNLTYSIQVDFINDSGSNVSVKRTIYDTGLEKNSIKIGNISIVEETINGRVLSGSFLSDELECGYRYNYDSDSEDYLITTNQNYSLNETINLINNTKMKKEFWIAKLIFSMVLRKDYKVVTLNTPSLMVTRTCSAQDESLETLEIEENLLVSKNSDQYFEETDKRITFKTDGDVIDRDEYEDFNSMKDVLDHNSRTYKEFLEYIEKIKTKVGRNI